MTAQILDFNDAPPQFQVIDPQEYEKRLVTLRTTLAAAAPDLVREVFPRARIQNHEARVGNVEGEPGESLSIGLQGERAGLWFDHATGDGGDLIDLWQRATRSTDFLQVVQDLERWCGMTSSPRWTSRVHKMGEARRQEAQEAPTPPQASLGEPVAHWLYTSADGTHIATVKRFDLAGQTDEAGKQKKTFRPFLSNGAPGMPDPRPLYRQADLVNAERVVLVEGEKCADALASVGVIATTAMGGASANPNKTDWSPLAGKDVLIWPDNDEPGRAMPEKVKAALEGVGARVTVLQIPTGRPPKWDAADAVAEGFDVPGLITTPATPPSRFRILTIEELVNVKPPEWRIDGIFPTHGSTALYGAYETFKTFVALDQTLSLACGIPWQGRELKPCGILYIAGEGQTGLGIRVAGWLAARGIDIRDVNFRALPEAVAVPNVGDQDDLLRAIDAMREPPGVIVWDTVTRMSGGGSLNDEKDAQAYVRGSDRVRLATGAHMFHIGHSGKDQSKGILGSIVLPAAMETIICIERRGDALTLINASPKGKQKEGPSFDDIRLRRRIVDFDHKGQALKTIILELDDEAEDASSTARQKGSAAPQGANQAAVMKELKKAKGAPLGANSLGGMTGLDGNRLTEVTRALVAKGLVHEVGEAGARRWVIA